MHEANSSGLGGPALRMDHPRREPTFTEALDEWMSRAPWLLISAALHFVALLVVASIPWGLFDAREEPVIECRLLAEEAEFEDPPPAPEEVIREVETELVPDVETVEPVEQPETDSDEPFERAEGDPELASDSPFDLPDMGAVIGVGPSGGGKYGQRLGGRRDRRGGGGERAEQALQAGLDWLRRHQDADGGWDCDGFMKHDPAHDECGGPGAALHDVGVTGLALLAFLGDGHTLRSGAHRDVVSRGVKWLRDQQDPEGGLIGEDLGHAFLYDHALATLALCEAYYFDKSPLLKGTAQRAVNYITRARNPYGAWRYDVPPIGDNDTSVTGWMVFALKSAEDAGLRVDAEAFLGARRWLDEMTDPATGRVGYDSVGSPSSRVDGRNEDFPTASGEALTAVALLCRIFMGETPEGNPALEQGAELLRRAPPKWTPSAKANDMYYWYYGTYALYQLGGAHWDAWNRALKPAVLESQRTDGAHGGSWDPVGPWGWSGGRVYATALMTLCLEVHYRYGRLLGAR